MLLLGVEGFGLHIALLCVQVPDPVTGHPHVSLAKGAPSSLHLLMHSPLWRPVAAGA